MSGFTDIQNFELSRQIYRVLVMHYLEGLKQAEIADKTGLSTAKVNRLIKQGKELGMLEIKIRSPYQPLLDVEEKLASLGHLSEALVAPAVSDNPEMVLQDVGAAAANLLLQTIKDGDTICITGGKGISAVLNGLNPERSYDVEVIPMTGCVQGKHYTDVNHVAAVMAEKLGGRAYQIHAPLFAETQEQRDMLLAMRAVDEVLEKARKADVAIFGIGSILSADSSYFDLHPISGQDQDAITRTGAVGELAGQLLDTAGQAVDFDLNRKLVALTAEEIHRIPMTIGVASGPNKAIPISSILRGQHIKALVTDEDTARAVLQRVEED